MNIDFIELIKSLDPNSPFLPLIVCAICVVLINISINCINSLSLTSIEILLINKNDDLKIQKFFYIIMFLLFTLENYLFASDILFINMCYLILFLLIILWITVIKCKKIEKYKVWFDEHKIFIILTIGLPIITYYMPSVTDVSPICISAVCGMICAVILALLFLDSKTKTKNFYIEIDQEKWYLLRRIDDEHILCGNDCNIIKSTEIKMFEVETIIQNKILNKCNISSESNKASKQK